MVSMPKTAVFADLVVSTLTPKVPCRSLWLKWRPQDGLDNIGVYLQPMSITAPVHVSYQVFIVHRNSPLTKSVVHCKQLSCTLPESVRTTECLET